jgi:hypothetical protein
MVTRRSNADVAQHAEKRYASDLSDQEFAILRGMTFEWYDHKRQILPDPLEYAPPVLVASPSSTAPPDTLSAILLHMVCPCAGGCYEADLEGATNRCGS